MLRKYDIFISYSRNDEHFVWPIVQLLGLSGRKVFVDTLSINPGEVWKESLKKALRSSKIVLLLWCCHSSKSEWVAREVSLALKDRKRVAPVMLCLSPMPKPVNDFQWINLNSLVSHECIEHETASPKPSEQFNFYSLLQREVGVDPSEPHTVDKAWANVVKPSLSSRRLIFNFRVLAGALLLALCIARPFPSPLPPGFIALVNLIGALLGLLMVLSGLLRISPIARDFFTSQFRRPVIIDQQSKLVALTIYSIVTQMERGELNWGMSGASDD